MDSRQTLAVIASVAVMAPGAAFSASQEAPRPTRPPMMSGPGSIAGVWSSTEFTETRTGPPVGQERGVQTADGLPIPWQPKAAAEVAEMRRRSQSGAPVEENSCLPNGMPAQMRPPAQLPIQILETPEQVTVLFEYHGVFRNIYLNEKPPEDPDPAFMGHSAGRWEGDTLVVETVGISERTRLFNASHSSELRLVERLRRTGPETLENRITIVDPQTFTRPWTWVINLKRVPGMRVMEYVCENERNAAGADGTTGVQLQSSTQ